MRPCRAFSPITADHASVTVRTVFHRLGVNWIGRDGHWSLCYVPQLAVTDRRSHSDLRLCDSSAPRDDVCVAHEDKVFRWGGEGPGLFRLLLTRGADEPNRLFADHTVVFKQLFRMGPVPVATYRSLRWMTGCTAVCVRCGSWRSSAMLEQAARAKVAAAVPPDGKLNRHIAANHVLDEVLESAAGGLGGDINFEQADDQYQPSANKSE